ncbi:MAG: T9SS type A sorting domain-containing protein [Aureispira sp.]|nr:T9SS type A sorting domain-containing protein [Aureispira sp.]
MKICVLILVLGFSFWAGSAQAQTIGNEVMNSAGSTHTASNGTQLKWSLGELIVGKLDGGNAGSLNHGHSLIVQETVGVEDVKALEIELAVYPNPTTSILNIQVEELPSKPLNARLLDVSGKQLKALELQDNSTNISVTDLPVGTYILTIEDLQAKTQKSYKIIKK